MTTTLIPRFVINLFDEGGSGDGGKGGEGGKGGGEPMRSPKTGEFVSAAEYERQIADLRKENADRRVREKETKSELEKTQAGIEAMKRKTLRAEARIALKNAGVIDDDVVELFVKHAGDKIKIDDNFEVAGIDDALKTFIEAKPVFFKAAEQSADDKAKADKEAFDKLSPAEKAAKLKADKDAADAAKRNSTSKGTSPAGGDGKGTDGKPLVDFTDTSKSLAELEAQFKAATKTGAIS